MPIQINRLVQHLCGTALWNDEAKLTDGQLLVRVIEQRDPAAIAALVRRHGSMVWGVCRRVLANHHDAEDAFQASFLVLVLKAAAIRKRESVASWLYGVAYRTALKARTKLTRRRTMERQVAAMPEPEFTEQHDWCDLHAVLDQELSRLPDKYRTPIVLCDLEGKTYREAARQLQWLEGTVAARLVRGRRLLARRLARRGVSLSVAALAAVLAEKVACASVPIELLSTTIRVVSLVPAGKAAAIGLISTRVVALADRVIRAMFVSKLMKVTAALLIGVALATFGTVLAVHNAAVQRNSADRSAGAGEQSQNDKEHLVALKDDSKSPPGAGSAEGRRGEDADADTKASGEKAPRRAGSLHLRFSDNSFVNILARDEKVTFVTEYGKLSIPVVQLQKLDLGRRVSDDVARKIAAAIAKLGSDDFEERERAAAELLRFGAKAYSDLQTAGEGGDLEVKLRARQILDKIKARIGPDSPQLRSHDIVWTGGSKIVGKVEDDVLQVSTLFGDIKVKLADVRSLGTEAIEDSGAKRDDALPDTGCLAGHTGQFGTKHTLKLTGRVDGAVWGSDVYTLDSTLASAAVHAGVLKAGQTGTVRVEIVESPPNFTGSTKNGVTTLDWAAFPQGSFRFIAGPIPPAFVPQSGRVAVQFVDGSIIEVTARDEKLTIVTDNGKVAVSVADIHSIDLATRIPENVQAKIEAAVKNLGSDNVKDRELANTDLLVLGARAYPALVTAAKDNDSEIGRRAQDMIARLKETLPPELLEGHAVDAISTKDSRFTGKLDSSTLRVSSPFLGDLELRLSDIHSLRSSSYLESSRE